MYNYNKNDDTVVALGCFGVIALAILLILVSPHSLDFVAVG